MEKKSKGCVWAYHGSKIRYLDNILEVIPDKWKEYRVIDLFSGGSSVATNLPDKWIVTANDQEDRVINFSVWLQNMLQFNTPEEVEEIVRNHCRTHISSREDKEGYDLLKQRYNNGDRTPLNLYALTMSSNSNMIRFNKSGAQTLQFGKRYYNENTKKKMLNYLNNLKDKKIDFLSEDYTFFSGVLKDKFDIWVIDPAYRTSKATYSENGQWTLQDEVNIMKLCDDIEQAGKKFIYFNQTFTQDVENKPVNIWKDKYNHLVLKDTTTNCSAQRKNKGKTVELMVHNF